ncbi:MAG: hypothetical protein QNJ47_09780 [Nostocaceae cyanobacterium]|nr:hypothetical protein [Nostocaceae cyanobacterium]
MQSKSKKLYKTPELLAYGTMEQLTQSSGSGGIDGIIGIDIDGDGITDVGIGTTTGSV